MSAATTIQDFEYAKSIARYNEISNSQLEKQPYTKGFLYITETGRFVFDSPYREQRIEIGGPVVIDDPIDFNEYVYTGKYSIETANSNTNAPMNNMTGLLEIIRGQARVFQKFYMTNGKMCFRHGIIASNNTISWSTWVFFTGVV